MEEGRPPLMQKTPPRKPKPSVPSLLKTQLGEMGGARYVESRTRKIPCANGGGKKAVPMVTEQPVAKRRALPGSDSEEEEEDWMLVKSMGHIINMQMLVRFWRRFSVRNYHCVYIVYIVLADC